MRKAILAALGRERIGRLRRRARRSRRHPISVLHSGRRVSGAEQLHLHELRAVPGDRVGAISSLHRQSLLCRRGRRRRRPRYRPLPGRTLPPAPGYGRY